MWVRGLKQPTDTGELPKYKVAPRVGAWIETLSKSIAKVTLSSSHPVWVRGLKQSGDVVIRQFARSHPVWVRGLKQRGSSEAIAYTPPRSHPVWVRGLKQRLQRYGTRGVLSHPVWVRGLKHFIVCHF